MPDTFAVGRAPRHCKICSLVAVKSSNAEYLHFATRPVSTTWKKAYDRELQELTNSMPKLYTKVDVAKLQNLYRQHKENILQWHMDILGMGDEVSALKQTATQKKNQIFAWIEKEDLENISQQIEIDVKSLNSKPITTMDLVFEKAPERTRLNAKIAEFESALQTLSNNCVRPMLEMKGEAQAGVPRVVKLLNVKRNAKIKWLDKESEKMIRKSIGVSVQYSILDDFTEDKKTQLEVLADSFFADQNKPDYLVGGELNYKADSYRYFVDNDLNRSTVYVLEVSQDAVEKVGGFIAVSDYCLNYGDDTDKLPAEFRSLYIDKWMIDKKVAAPGKGLGSLLMKTAIVTERKLDADLQAVKLAAMTLQKNNKAFRTFVFMDETPFCMTFPENLSSLMNSATKIHGSGSKNDVKKFFQNKSWKVKEDKMTATTANMLDVALRYMYEFTGPDTHLEYDKKAGVDRGIKSEIERFDAFVKIVQENAMSTPVQDLKSYKISNNEKLTGALMNARQDLYDEEHRNLWDQSFEQMCITVRNKFLDDAQIQVTATLQYLATLDDSRKSETWAVKGLSKFEKMQEEIRELKVKVEGGVDTPRQSRIQNFAAGIGTGVAGLGSGVVNGITGLFSRSETPQQPGVVAGQDPAAEEPVNAAEEPGDAAEEPGDTAEEPGDTAEEPSDAMSHRVLSEGDLTFIPVFTYDFNADTVSEMEPNSVFLIVVFDAGTGDLQNAIMKKITKIKSKHPDWSVDGVYLKVNHSTSKYNITEISESDLVFRPCSSPVFDQAIDTIRFTGGFRAKLTNGDDFGQSVLQQFKDITNTDWSDEEIQRRQMFMQHSAASNLLSTGNLYSQNKEDAFWFRATMDEGGWIEGESKKTATNYLCYINRMLKLTKKYDHTDCPFGRPVLYDEGSKTYKLADQYSDVEVQLSKDAASFLLQKMITFSEKNFENNAPGKSLQTALQKKLQQVQPPPVAPANKKKKKK